MVMSAKQTKNVMAPDSDGDVNTRTIPPVWLHVFLVP
jgi:hypothetical protein